MLAEITADNVRTFCSPAGVTHKLRVDLLKWAKASKERRMIPSERAAIRAHVRSGLAWWRQLAADIRGGNAQRAAWSAVALCELLANLKDWYDLIPRHNKLAQESRAQRERKSLGAAKTNARLRQKRDKRREAILRIYHQVKNRYARGDVGMSFIYAQIDAHLKSRGLDASERTIRGVINGQKKSPAKR